MSSEAIETARACAEDALMASAGHALSTEEPAPMDKNKPLEYVAYGADRRVLGLLDAPFPAQYEIDLHGHTVDEAASAIATLFQNERRLTHIRIIHGVGRHSKQGRPLLKAYINRWLKGNPDIVAFASARRSDGGVGRSMQSPAVCLTIIGDEPDLLLSFHKFHQTALSLHLSLVSLFTTSKWIITRLELDFIGEPEIFRTHDKCFQDAVDKPLVVLGLITMDDYTRRIHSALMSARSLIRRPLTKGGWWSTASSRIRVRPFVENLVVDASYASRIDLTNLRHLCRAVLRRNEFSPMQ